MVAISQFHAANTRSGTTHWSYAFELDLWLAIFIQHRLTIFIHNRGFFGLFKANHFTEFREQHNFAFAIGDIHTNQRVFVTQVERNQTIRTNVGKLIQRCFLHSTVTGCHEDEFIFTKLSHWQNRGDALVFFQRKQVHDWLTTRSTAGERQLVYLHTVSFAASREQQNVIVSIGNQKTLNVVLFFHLGCALTFTTTTLCFVVAQ
ncbi:Uncharacterised protein [Vibrio cholerae]|nr:Uncharacterised protein [Vibrio cholerae]CSA22553.1 Uncharacterised protein [Vibrio cholerae]CSB79958.1 Uncharacterised protein [Vibrio cholerae]